MAFPCPAAGSLDPMDHFLSFDVSLTIPKNYIKYYIHVFSPITAYIRGFDPYNRVHWDVCINPNTFGVFLDLDLTHSTPDLPYALRSHENSRVCTRVSASFPHIDSPIRRKSLDICVGHSAHRDGL